MTIARVAMEPVPIAAFSENLAAYHLAPWDLGIRRQLPLSMSASLRGDARVKPAAAKVVFDIGRSSSPVWVGILVAEGEYLLNSHQDAEPQLALLRRYARLHSATWILEGHAAAVTGDAARLVHAVNTGTRLHFVPEEHRGQYERLRALLEVR
jgi:hypothetical protein